MIYTEKKEDNNFIYEPQLEEKFEPIVITSPKPLNGKLLDLLFDHILKLGISEGEVEIPQKEKFKIKFNNHNKTWEEDENEHK